MLNDHSFQDVTPTMPLISLEADGAKDSAPKSSETTAPTNPVVADAQSTSVVQGNSGVTEPTSDASEENTETGLGREASPLVPVSGTSAGRPIASVFEDVVLDLKPAAEVTWRIAIMEVIQPLVYAMPPGGDQYSAEDEN
jgi:hypothetical protein